jgi:AcrR family transcriptional regulator
LKEQRHVIQDLMEATEHALAGKTAKEITVREICTAAGANQAMVHYYFGSKEGLLVAVLQDFMDGAPHTREAEIVESCLSHRSIRPLVDALFDFYHSRPNLIIMILVELLNSSSVVKDVYINRYSSCTNILIENVANVMKEADIYRKDVNSRFLALSLKRMVIAPIIQPHSTGFSGMSSEGGHGAWATYIAQTFDAASMQTFDAALMA